MDRSDTSRMPSLSIGKVRPWIRIEPGTKARPPTGLGPWFGVGWVWVWDWNRLGPYLEPDLALGQGLGLRVVLRQSRQPYTPGSGSRCKRQRGGLSPTPNITATYDPISALRPVQFNRPSLLPALCCSL